MRRVVWRERRVGHGSVDADGLLGVTWFSSDPVSFGLTKIAMSLLRGKMWYI